jgi:hypothetical protein
MKDVDEALLAVSDDDAHRRHRNRSASPFMTQGSAP